MKGWISAGKITNGNGTNGKFLCNVVFSDTEIAPKWSKKYYFTDRSAGTKKGTFNY